jgi:nickel/cobalt exporter
MKGWLIAALLSLASVAHADTVASLLGNFTINQYCGVQLDASAVKVHYVVVFGQLPALRELHRADANGDGVTTQAERDDYVRRLAPEFARELVLTVDDVRIPFELTRWASSLPTEQGGFSLRLEGDFSAALSPASGLHTLRFDNRNFAGRFGWNEIVVQAVPPLTAFDTNAFTTSLTASLTEALRQLPAEGPLDERSVQLRFVRGRAPAHASVLGPRRTAPLEAQAVRAGATGDSEWLQRQTRHLIELISGTRADWRVRLWALLAALLLGALHALSPGHGKTIVGAYLVGSRGTARHAVFLGLTVTATHTVGVFALGFATLVASRFIVPERLFPVLSLISGLIVLAMGMILTAQRWRSLRAPPAHGHHHHHDGEATHTHAETDRYGLVHSHGGSLHLHAPPGADGRPVTVRSLLALGISGGLVPCPSAMVLLLAAVALNQTAYGMVLVLVFSLGLAGTLTAVGVAFLFARNRLGLMRGDSTWPRVLPVLSAAVITVVGMTLCFAALTAARY